MGRSRRERPKHLGRKLAMIRKQLGLTQPELIKRLNVKQRLHPAAITLFEKGEREPTALVLLRYARIYGCNVEELIDDQLKLPTKGT